MNADSRPARLAPVLVVFLVVSTLVSVLLVAGQGLVGLDPGVLTLTQFSTAVGALVVWLVWRRRLPRPMTSRTDLARAVLAVLAATLVLVVVLLAARALLDTGWAGPAPGSLAAPLGVVVLAQLLGAAGEEVGWRGVVQPALETRLRLVPAGALTGLLFGLGHLGGADGFGRFLLFLGSAVLLSWALAFLTAGRGVWVRVLLATGLHWLVNLATLVGFADGDDSAAWAVANVVAAALAALAVRLVLGGSRTRTAQVPHAVRPTPTAPAAPAAPAAPEASQSKDA